MLEVKRGCREIKRSFDRTSQNFDLGDNWCLLQSLLLLLPLLPILPLLTPELLLFLSLARFIENMKGKSEQHNMHVQLISGFQQ